MCGRCLNTEFDFVLKGVGNTVAGEGYGGVEEKLTMDGQCENELIYQCYVGFDSQKKATYDRTMFPRV